MLSAYLNGRITIQTKTVTKDTIGTPVETWTDLADVWSGVRQSSGSLSYDSDPDSKIHSFSTVFQIRYLEGFGYNCRIKYNGDIYDILSIETLRRREGYNVIAERRENND